MIGTISSPYPKSKILWAVLRVLSQRIFFLLCTTSFAFLKREAKASQGSNKSKSDRARLPQSDYSLEPFKTLLTFYTKYALLFSSKISSHNKNPTKHTKIRKFLLSLYRLSAYAKHTLYEQNNHIHK